MSANAMFSLAELEAAAHLVHRTVPPRHNMLGRFLPNGPDAKCG